MDEEVKIVGNFTRKAKINIFIVVFLIFIIISVFASINQISNIIKKREKLTELEEQLNWERSNNIKLLAEEKMLYNKEAVEIEARKQFNMAKEGEVNYFVEIVEDENYRENLNFNTNSNKDTSDTSYKAFNTSSKVYKESDLWENLKTFYNSEIKGN